MNITVVGTGYVGLVTGSCLSDLEHKVYCVDIDKNKIDALNNGIVPIYEENLEKIIDKNINKNLFFTTNLKESLFQCNVCIIAVGTPTNSNGGADLTAIYKVAHDIAYNLFNDLVIVVKSTVPVGTCETIKSIIEEKTSYNIDVVSNPEFLKEGTAVNDFFNPDRIVIGADNWYIANMIKSIYKEDEHKYIVTDVRSSELSKYVSNAMLANRISFMNEMSNICEKVGANINEVELIVGSDERIGYDFLKAGCGYGGSCFPKDVNALIKMSEDKLYTPKILKEVININNNQKIKLVEKVISIFGKNLKNMTFSTWGLTFKPNTDDMREAPSITIINELLNLGAKVNVHDPMIKKIDKSVFNNHKNINFYLNKYNCLKNSEALLLITEWEEYKNPDFVILNENLNNKIIIDGRNQYNKKTLNKNGFKYYQIGVGD